MKKIFNYFLMPFFGILLLLAGTYYVFAESTWVNPTEVPPAGNAYRPLDTSTTLQQIGDDGTGTKTIEGSLTLSGANNKLTTPEICLGAEPCRTTWPAGTSYWTLTGNDIYNSNTGKVGVGTGSTFYEKFEVRENAKNSTARLRITDDFENPEIQLHYGAGASSDHWAIYDNQTDDSLRIWNPSSDKLTILSGGNVGIGTNDPGAKLEVNGQVKITGGTPGAGKILTSDATGLATWQINAGGGSVDGSGTQNYVSKWSDSNTLTDSQIFDDGAIVSIKSAGTPSVKLVKNNVDVSAWSSDDVLNTFLGLNSGRVNAPAAPQGINNTFIGSSSGYSNTSGFSNTALGRSALYTNTLGSRNTALGATSLGLNTTGSDNIAVGSAALPSNTTGSNNISIGNTSLTANTTGAENIAIGAFTAQVSNGSQNVIVGYMAGNAGSNNSFLGYKSGYGVSGSNNIAVGYFAASGPASGNRNITIGDQINTPSLTESNLLNIGNMVYGTGIDGTGGNLSTGKIGIGVAAPATRLEIADTTAAASTLRVTEVTASQNAEFQLQYGANASDHWSIYNNQTPDDQLRIWSRGFNGVADYYPGDRLSINQNGRVGINTTSPQAQLDVRINTNFNNAEAKIFTLLGGPRGLPGSFAAPTMFFGALGPGSDFTTREGYKWQYNGENSESERSLETWSKQPVGGNLMLQSLYPNGSFVNLGNVGIQENSLSPNLPTEKLVVTDLSGGTARARIYDNVQNPELQLKFGSGASDHWGIYVANPNNNPVGNGDLVFWQNGNGVRFDQTGGIQAGAFYYASDQNLKKNIKVIEKPLDLLSQLRGVHFNWKSNDQGAYGMIAQEVEKVLPEAVKTNSEGIKSIDYAQVNSLLIESIKEQQKTIDQLTERIEALENK